MKLEPFTPHSAALLAFLLLTAAFTSRAAAQSATPPPAYGPYNVHSISGGIGVTKTLAAHDPLALSGSGWSLSLWVKPDTASQTVLLAGVGQPLDAFPRFLGLRDGKPIFWAGDGHILETSTPLAPNTWHSLAVFVEGADTHLLVDGADVAHAPLPIGPATPELQIAPIVTPATGFHHFSGLLAFVSLARGFSPSEQQSLSHAPANLDDLTFDDASKPWPVQTRQWIGYRSPQDPATLPRSAAPPQQPVAQPEPHLENPLSNDNRTLTLRANWRMSQASNDLLDGARISSPGFDDSHWYAAVVPGTVLTTLVARGVYPDPDFGLNNMAIPESLSHQRFWFRTHFNAPPATLHGHPSLTFLGINYRAQVWLNGHALGVINGAFNRGRFDVASLLTPGDNVLAVLISPPDHPGIPHEQSLADGPGENGGLMAIDGPTFADTEGWDWIPAIRDRDMGIWQDVTLSAQGPVSLDTPQIITTLPLPDTSRAAITLRVPLNNETQQPLHATLELAFEGVTISKPVTIAPGASTITLTPGDTPQLNIAHPRLWWPNGYGSPELYHLTASLRIGNQLSDRTSPPLRHPRAHLRAFAARLHRSSPPRRDRPLPRRTHQRTARRRDSRRHSRDSARMGRKPHARRRALARRSRHQRPRHAARTRHPRQRRSHRRARRRLRHGGHAQARLALATRTLLPSAARRAHEHRPQLDGPEHRRVLLRSRRRVRPARLERLLGLHAGLQPRARRLRALPAQCARHHPPLPQPPSIAVWCGRNEGVPAPAVNQGLIDLIAELDGTRLYSASSNRVNLHDSGPYKYQEPSEYFTHLALGFAVEIGLPSPPTLEAFESFLPKEDQWPISDDWAYHDWHQGGNGDTAVFMKAMNEQFGPPSSLADFDRKAQMLNYVSHRAVFEGFNAHLWNPNSGRMLWMTQPAWPSTEWQIFSHDYDTHAAYYGVKLASEPIHIQLNLPNYEIAIINNTTAALPQLSVHAQVFDLSSKLLFERSATVDATANATTASLRLALEDAFTTSPVVFVKLTLSDTNGKSLSQNFYWLAAHEYEFRKLNDLPTTTLQASATIERNGSEQHINVKLTNPSPTTALSTKVTLLDGPDGQRILPAYYSDNYISLLPNEHRTIDITYPSSPAYTHPVVAVRGWNVTPATIDITR